ncbi:MAG: hypothetical protein OWR52_02275 [Acidibacillus sp.]|uniref:Uncharacterized protein n=1 Tax=Sulfoacidibacillus ferrooxidans TaxID=2005001 RepID=A0A9X1VE65_9BACL|nr:hypothetical protein [Sulfoacidibacillus ferrooxidans]MCI0184402.1 hypothetical protein [Sulfoacidibacillus ferrooxidans]MCY0892324.1 hypothetical protein [Acidibacillus sp.]
MKKITQLASVLVLSFTAASMPNPAFATSQKSMPINNPSPQFNAPPSHFNPLTATDTQRAQYGFPARQNVASAVARWKIAVEGVIG